MKKITKLLALLLALVMVFGVLAACAKSDSTTSNQNTTTSNNGSESTGSADNTGDSSDASENDYTLTIGVTTSNNTHDPSVDDAAAMYQSKTIWEALLEIDPVTGEIQPCLAESVEYIDDYTVEVKLRDNVYFTNGQKLSANDVMVTYRDLTAAGKMGSYFSAYDWENSEIVDDLTVRFALTEQYGPGISLMTTFRIYCAEDLFGDNAMSADDWMSNPNGTGPYYCVENVNGSHVTYARKDAADYWGELPECTEVTYKYYSETTAMYIDFETGALDVVNCVAATDAQRVIDGDCPEFAAYDINPIKDVLLLCLPQYVEYFQDQRVREAIAMAVDAEACAIAGFGCLYLPADSILPASVLYYEAQEAYENDIEAAKALLAEAGYPDGFTLRIVITQDNQTVAEALQACLQQIGITLNVESYDFPTAIPMMMQGDTDLCLKQSTGGATAGDPAQLLDTLGPDSTLAAARIEDPTWVEAFNLGLYSGDADTRAEGYAACQQWARETSWVIPICERAAMTVYNTNKLSAFPLTGADCPVVMDAVFAY